MADLDFWEYCSDWQSAIPPLEPETRNLDVSGDMNMVDSVFSDSLPPEWDISNWSTSPIPATSLPMAVADGNPALPWNDNVNICSPQHFPPHFIFTPCNHLTGTLSTCDICSSSIDGNEIPKEDDGQADGWCPSQDISDRIASSHIDPSCNTVMEGVRDSSLGNILPISSANLADDSLNMYPNKSCNGLSISLCAVDEGGASNNRITDITMNELSTYFNVPITEAAKKLNVGLTVLKKRCRELGIPRWPHRKMKSLEGLINNIQELGQGNGGLRNERLGNAVEILEEQRKLMEKNPSIELADRTKRLRQACFKASYKKRKQIAIEDTALYKSKPAERTL